MSASSEEARCDNGRKVTWLTKWGVRMGVWKGQSEIGVRKGTKGKSRNRNRDRSKRRS